MDQSMRASLFLHPLYYYWHEVVILIVTACVGRRTGFPWGAFSETYITCRHNLSPSKETPEKRMRGVLQNGVMCSNDAIGIEKGTDVLYFLDYVEDILYWYHGPPCPRFNP